MRGYIRPIKGKILEGALLDLLEGFKAILRPIPLKAVAPAGKIDFCVR